jgi:TP901 family phage tail tape measure protein
MPSARGIRAGAAYIELYANDNRLVRGLKRAEKRLKAFGTSVRQIGARLVGIGASVGAGFAISTRVFAGFDDRMRAVRAVTGATEKQFQSLREEAKRLGRTTSFTAGQVAEAMTELGRAGFKPEAILSSTEAVLALARATSTELPRATEIAGAALQGFALPVDQMDRVTDVLTATANKSAQTLDDLAEAMKPVAPIAVEAGASIEDTAAAIAVLANNGIKGSRAGNALARAYKNLSNESRQAELRKIGVEAVDAQGNLRPLADILNDLARATQRLGSAQRLSIFETLFGRGQAAALKLASSAEAFDDLRDQIKSSAGVAIKTAEEMDAGIGGSFRKLLSAVEGIAIAIGEAIQKPIRRAADAITKIAGWITNLINQNRQLVVTILKVTAVVIGVGIALIVAGAAIVGLGAVFGSLSAIITGVGAAIGVLGTVLAALLSPIGLVVAAVVGVGVAMLTASGTGAEALNWLGEQFGTLRETVTKVISGMADALAAGDLALAAQILWLSLKLVWQKGVAALNTAWLEAKRFFISTAQKMWFGALAAAQIGFHAIEVAWIETTSFLSKTWTKFSSGFKKIWETATSFVAKRMLEIQGLFDSSLDVTAAKKAVDDQLESRLAEIQSQAQQALAQRDQRRQRQRDRARETHEGTLAEIGRQFDEAQKALDDRTNEKVEQTQRALEEARRQLDAAITKAAKKRRDVEAAGPDTTAPDSPEGLVARIQSQLAGLGGVLARSGATVRGTFNAAAIQGLASSSDADERTARATEETAQHTKKIADAAKNGGLAFT